MPRRCICRITAGSPSRSKLPSISSTAAILPASVNALDVRRGARDLDGLADCAPICSIGGIQHAQRLFGFEARRDSSPRSRRWKRRARRARLLWRAARSNWPSGLRCADIAAVVELAVHGVNVAIEDQRRCVQARARPETGAPPGLRAQHDRGSRQDYQSTGRWHIIVAFRRLSMSNLVRPKLAAIVTTYFKYSHAQHIVDRLLDGYGWNGTHHYPPMDLVSLYVDQVGANRPQPRARRARHPSMKIYPTIAEALTAGGSKLAVDGVVLVGEHGNYPRNEKGRRSTRATNSSNRS